MKTSLTVVYAAPEDGPTIEEATEVARRLHLTFDEFVSRAISLYYEEVVQQMKDPKVQGQFDLDRIAAETVQTDPPHHAGESTE